MNEGESPRYGIASATAYEGFSVLLRSFFVANFKNKPGKTGAKNRKTTKRKVPEKEQGKMS